MFTLQYINSAIRGYHAYKDVWPNPFVGEVLRCECKERNAHDPFAVALKKLGTVGHQQVEIARDPSLPCGRAQKSQLINNFCVKFKKRKFLTKRYP